MREDDLSVLYKGRVLKYKFNADFNLFTALLLR